MEVIKVASTKSLNDVLKAAAKCAGTVQLFDSSKVISKKHLLGAYLNAQLTFKEKTNIANTIAMEMLLFASMKKQIKDAIPAIGAKSAKRFVVFADSKKSFKGVSNMLINIKDFAPSVTDSLKTARHYSINTKDAKELDVLILQKMAIARISD